MIQVKYDNIIIIQKHTTFISFLDFTEQFFSNLWKETDNNYLMNDINDVRWENLTFWS